MSFDKLERPHDHDKSKFSRFRKLFSQSSYIQIKLMEPTLYFKGNPEESLGCFMRGELIMNLNKPTKIKQIEMKFSGRMKTYKPQCKTLGSRSNHNDNCKECELITFHWIFLSPPTKITPIPPSTISSIKKYHLLPAGIYTFPFELFLPGTLPETILGNVSYKLRAKVIRTGLSSNFRTLQHMTIVRILSNSQGITNSRNWQNSMNHEIAISNKAYSTGDSINIDLEMIPQAKVVHILGLRIELSEKSIYKSRGQQNVKSKVLTTYHTNGFFGGNEEDDEFLPNGIHYHKNFVFPLPKCSNHIHSSWSWKSITISHNLKFYINVKSAVISEKAGITNKFKKEIIEIDIPIILLLCKCAENSPRYDSFSNLGQLYMHDLPPSYEASQSYNNT
ncbi:9515_t:CDS:2 [Funneliformis geosporum]|uniref:18000_t:CDS:1 n=1 Tax=Funneliformis geosporum TaxID=1117311 RepID=A0A9W4SYD4_9GLOM|nr:9515_t:CDS:2 [Funneliformis geosporum]CAI2183604.1 18000_t:CDS:2 [Funneliformis geosporum]